jgi:multidrug efflux pump subunit AcrA (membrane-fusion protein)
MAEEAPEKIEPTSGISAQSDLRSEAMSELMSRRPGFLGRWALPLFLLILILLVCATWFIHYPDIIKTKATLIATNAPKEIVIRQEGRLVKLFVQNDDSVSKGKILGYIESSANHQQVHGLSILIDTTVSDLHKNSTQNIVTRFGTNFDGLGELQQGYQQFVTAQQQFIDYLQNGFYLKKKRVLDEDLSSLIKNHEIVQQQKELLVKDLNLSEETYKANVSLLKDKVISKQDDRNEQSKLLSKQLSIPQINATLLANETQQREKKKEISDLEHSISLQKVIFQQATQTFQNLINEWKKKYIIDAPISGKVVFLVPLQENQFLTAGKSIGFISPGDSHFYAEITLPQYNFGKASTGQPVQLRFDAYPYQEFGFVAGKLSYISSIPSDSGFLGHIQLDRGLMTNQRRSLQYREGLKAEALIITEDMRLLQRFYNNVTSLGKR